jgi:hypothetical protein
MIVDDPTTAQRIESMRLVGPVRDLIKAHEAIERAEAALIKARRRRDVRAAEIINETGLTEADLTRVLGVSATTASKINRRGSKLRNNTGDNET